MARVQPVDELPVDAVQKLTVAFAWKHGEMVRARQLAERTQAAIASVRCCTDAVLEAWVEASHIMKTTACDEDSAKKAAATMEALVDAMRAQVAEWEKGAHVHAKEASEELKRLQAWVTPAKKALTQIASALDTTSPPASAKPVAATPATPVTTDPPAKTAASAKAGAKPTASTPAPVEATSWYSFLEDPAGTSPAVTPLPASLPVPAVFR